MRVVLAGGSGFLGRALRASLERNGHTVVVLTRSPRSHRPWERAWQPTGASGAWAAELDGADAVINLAGEGIADRRWSEEQKRRLSDSRLLPTRSLVRAIIGCRQPPPVFLSSSAVGIYGDRGEETITEASAPGSGFLADLCVAWEREAEPAEAVTRLTLLRTGIVLHPDGGALKTMVPLFRWGVGGMLGSGQQFMPWIHLHDWVALVRRVIEDPRASGAFHLSAPFPVSNAEFTRTLGKMLRRPAVMPVPSFGLRLLYGEFAQSLLEGQRALPVKAEQLGFEFRFPQLEPALRDLKLR